MNKQTIKKLVPELRFPVFRDTGEWSFMNGNLVFDQISNKNHNSDIPILAITQEFGAIPREKIDYNVSVTDKSIESYKVIEVGDFIISLRSFQGGIEYSDYKGICSPAYIILRKKNNDDVNHYFKQYFKTGKFIQDLNRDIEGIRDGKMVSYKQFSNLLLPRPLLEEQQKIADCLSSLDELITAQTQKLDGLKTHKKGLMQQLFPAEGETLPKLRFPEFLDAGEWDAKQLKDACLMQAGKFVKAAEIHEKSKDEFYPCYGGNGLRGFTQTFTHTGKFSLIGRQGALCGNVNLAIGKFHATEHAVVTTPKEGVDTNWFFYMLGYLNLNQYATGQAQPGLSVENLEKVLINIPKKEKEQQKIADCLSSIDELIAAASQKIDSLKTHKKGLMQQLFPVVDEVDA